MTANSNAIARWQQFWRNVDGEDWLTAKALIELSPALHREAAGWLARGAHLRDWVDDVDARGRGWSSTEGRLFRVVAALLDPAPDSSDAREVPYAIQMGDDRVRRAVPLSYFLELLGSWEGDLWRILTEWGTGGNNRDRTAARP